MEGCWKAFLGRDKGWESQWIVSTLCQHGRNNSPRVKLNYFSPIKILGKGCGGFLGGGVGG